MTQKIVWVSAIMAMSASAWAPLNLGRMDVTLTPATQKFCHIVRFRQGWAPRLVDEDGQPLAFDHTSEFEFRVVGLQGSNFLVGAYQELGERYEAAKRYQLNLSDPSAPALLANRKDWDSAAVVPIARKSVFSSGESLPNEKQADFHGFQFGRTGSFWIQPSHNATRVSPDGAWLVLQSTTDLIKTSATQDVATKVFLDVFNAGTGKKVITIPGVYTSNGLTYDVDGYLAKTGWLTERYFIVPLGEHKERCLVCEFGSAR